MYYPYNAYLNESILDNITSADNVKSSALEVANQSSNENDKTVRITFSFDIMKYDLKNQKSYEKLFHILVSQFEDSHFICSFNVDNVAWDHHEKRDQTFSVENHSIDVDKKYREFLSEAYQKSIDSPYDHIFIINRFNIEPTAERYPFRKFCREIYRWFLTLALGNNNLYESLNVLVMRMDYTDMFAIPFKGSSLRLMLRDIESMYRKLWPDSPKSSLMSSSDFEYLFGQKDTFPFRRFLKYLHNHQNMFPGVDITVRGDGTWKSKVEKVSDNQFEEWRIYLKFSEVKDGLLHSSNDAIDFVRNKIYGHFGPGDRFMLMKQVKTNHIFHLTVKFLITIPVIWKDDENSTVFFELDTFDIPQKMQFYNGPSKIPVEFITMCANPDVYGAEVILDEDGEWTERHISWFQIGAVMNNFMESDNRYTEIR